MDTKDLALNPQSAIRDPQFHLRVADFTWVIAGPLAMQHLAVHGADVIRIESRGRPDTLRNAPPMVGGAGPDHSAYFADFNQGKRGVTLNLRHPHAVQLARRLIATCDVVAENFAAGTMERLGLGYDALRQVRPDLIMLSMSLAGQTGPERTYKGFGTVLQGSAGITHLTGWPDRPPVGTGVAYTDFLAAEIGAFALLAALEYRERTGHGQHIDLSQQEASLYALDAALLDYAVNGRVQTRQGNRHPAAAPHGAFRCKDSDSNGSHTLRPPNPQSAICDPRSEGWVAIAVTCDAEWRGLKAAMGSPRWADEPRFTTLLGRKTHEDELDGRIEVWTRGLAAREAERHLAAHGVPAAVVASARELYEDPHLMARGHFLNLRHPVQGDFPFDAPSYRLDGAVPAPPRPAPLVGEHNAAVFEDLLGLSPAAYRALEAEGVFN